MTTGTSRADDEFRGRLRAPPNPIRMLISPTGWRAVLYCFTSILVGLAALLGGVLGLLVLPLVTWATANLERSRLTLLGLPRLNPLPRSRVRHPWDLKGLGDGNLAVWGITVLFGLVDALPGGFLAAGVLVMAAATRSALANPWSMEFAVTFGGLLIVLVAGLYLAWALAAAQAIMVDNLLRPHSDLRAQVDELTSSRRELVDLFAAERRRIEHDLHDGAQQHLVVLSMQLGEVEFALDEGRLDDARGGLDAARTSVEAAIASLREAVRGIHPQILIDRGLVAAVKELAGRQSVPVRVDVVGDRLPAEQLGLAVFYLVSEAFTNIAKHSGARTAAVRLTLTDPLQIEVYDDGGGGAQVRPGHGLSGLVERTHAVGGSCWITSPPGGPTLVRASFPNPEGASLKGR